jgi:nucleoside-diphosphate kinase
VDKNTGLPSEADIREGGASVLLTLGGALESAASHMAARAKEMSPAAHQSSPLDVIGITLGSAVLEGLGSILAGGAELAGEIASGIKSPQATTKPETATGPVEPPEKPTPQAPSREASAASAIPQTQRSDRTLAIIKCGAMQRGSKMQILGRIIASGLDIVALREMRLSAREASSFYVEHDGRGYYAALIQSVSDAEQSVTVMVLQAENAIGRWRAMLGATDPARAESGSIRHDFGRLLPDNAAHGSDGSESAAREIAMFFPAMSG